MNKNVLITGGSRGIGLGIAKELAKMGCNLAINGIRDVREVEPVLQELKGLGAGQVIYCQGDVSIHKERDGIVARTLERLDQIHVLINNAGVAPRERVDLLQTTEESYDRVLGINLKGPFFLTQSVALHMIEKSQDSEGFRCIINISSISATVASINRAEYCLSKAAMGMMTQLFATRLGMAHIPVYEVRPGIIETDMTAGVLEKYKESIAEGLTLQSRLGKPEDVGKVVAALATNEFPYSTGQVVMVDGGLTIQRL